MKARKILSAALIGLSISFGLVSPLVPKALADSNVQEGLQLMQQKNYPRAVASFEQALRVNPSNQSALYCLGTCYYEMRNIANAKSYYQSAVKVNPNSPTGKAAMTALKSVGLPPRQGSPSAVRTTTYSSASDSKSNAKSTFNSSTSSSSSSGGSGFSLDEPTDSASLPNEGRARFQRNSNNHLMVEAFVDNRPIDMVFDTGAEHCVMGFNHLQQLGIPTPTGKPTGKAIGLGSAGVQNTWVIRTKLKVGSIERKNFPLTVQKYLPTDPLLGQNFFREFHYAIQPDADPSSGTIQFTRNSGRSVGSIYRQRDSNYEVPYTLEGRNMLVSVLINGKPLTLFFDTGASDVILSKELAKSINLEIPDDAREGLRGGASGGMKSLDFPVRSIKMGPIEKTNFQISVIDQMGVRHGLLGQSFFGDWRYDIDSINKVIKFRR